VAPISKQYLADQAPSANLAPKNGTLERVRLQEMLNYLATEFHKSHTPLFYPELQSVSEFYVGRVKKCYDFLSDKLKGHDFIMGNQFSVADAYMFTILNWHGWVKIDITPWPLLVEYKARISQRPHVQAAMKQEGLI